MVRSTRGAVAALAVVVSALTISAGVGNASPVPGGQPVSFALPIGPPAFFLDSPFGSPTGSPLPSSACALSVGSTALTGEVRGWEGPVLDEILQTREVDLHATITGTLIDTRGAVYNVSGTFRQTGETPPFFGVPFFGAGRLTIAGPGGVVSGTATFVDVATGPPELDFYFSGFDVCKIR